VLDSSLITKLLLLLKGNNAMTEVEICDLEYYIAPSVLEIYSNTCQP
jgi:hypothetical protein